MQIISIQFRKVVTGDAWLPLTSLGSVDDPDGALVPITLPEWRSGISTTAADSPACICASLSARGVHIKATFQRDAGDPQQMLVRAVDPSGANLLGEIPEQPINFASATASIEVPLSPAPTNTITTHADTWNWQARPINGQWAPIATTNHEVFITLAPPATPWNSDDAGPAVEVLRLVCLYAAGASKPAQVADRITSWFYSLGRPSASRAVFAYTPYTQFCDDDVFDCGRIVAGINGLPDLVTTVDCFDCASLVSTFANCVGANIYQAKLGIGIGTRYIQLIGQNGMAATVFTFHGIAWGGKFRAEDPVWDACLMVDQDADPGSAPYSPGNALGLAFGAFSDHGYMWRLVDPLSASSVTLIDPFTGKNRSIGRYKPYRADVVSGRVKPGAWFYWNFQIREQLLHPWELERVLYLNPATLPILDSTWGALESGASTLVRVRAAASHSVASAQATLEKWMTAYTAPVVDFSIGDRGYALRDYSHITFRRGNLVVDIGAASRLMIPLNDKAHHLDEQLVDMDKLPPPLMVRPGAVDIRAWVPLQDSNGAPLSYRLYSDTGEIRAVKGQLQFFAASHGPQDVVIFQHDSQGGVTKTVHQFELE